ncbi:MAG: hypothetical protein JW941_11360 [Candidatus Coatesbacteria bacterium]|nr:hypothetical protein [Candidatus Coatesbacteria bacterium]
MKGIRAIVPYVVFIGMLVAGHASGNDLVIEHIRPGPNRIECMDYKDGTLAIGTYEAGLVVVKDGNVMTFTTDNGLPDDSVFSARLKSESEIYLQFDTTSDQLAHIESLFAAELDGPQLRLTDITPANGLRFLGNNMVTVSQDGVLWCYDDRGLKKFDASFWVSYGRAPVGLSYLFEGNLLIDAQGDVWIRFCHRDVEQNLVRFYGSSWDVQDIQGVKAVGIDDKNKLWCSTTEPPALYRRSGNDWELMSDDAVLGRDSYSGVIQFDASGGVWLFGRESMLRWSEPSVTKVSDLFGMPIGKLRKGSDSPFFSCSALIESDILMIGTSGYGLLALEDGHLSRFHSDRAPGNHARSIGLDSNGFAWFYDLNCPVICGCRGDAWRDIIQIGMDGYSSRHAPLMDLDGTLFFQVFNYRKYPYREFSIAAIRDSNPVAPDTGLWPIKGPLPIVDRSGTLWFSPDFLEPGPPYSISGNVLTKYDASQYFRGSYTTEVKIGPGDVKWFKTDFGFTTFDGKEWTHFFPGDNIPKWVLELDINGGFLTCSPEEGRDLVDADGRRTKLCDEEDLWNFVQDADGKWWSYQGEAYEPKSGLFCGNSIEDWRQISMEDGLSSPWITSFLIDHNGDKWVGTWRAEIPGAKSRLNRIIDGGAAQQKLVLSLEESDDSSLVVTGAFTNAIGSAYPVLLWLACEHNGSMYYYPDWGPIPTPVKYVICGKSIETHELLRMDTAALPPGEYTFYGAISLLGGFDCLIGARGKKVSVVSHHRD